MNQIVRDWRNNPITDNFFTEVKIQRDNLAESILSGGLIGDVHEINRRIGLIQGLDALLEYEPEVDEDGVIV